MADEELPRNDEISYVELVNLARSVGWSDGILENLPDLKRLPGHRRLVRDWIEVGFPPTPKFFYHKLDFLCRYGVSPTLVSEFEDTRSVAEMAELLCTRLVNSGDGVAEAMRDFLARGGTDLNHFLALVGINKNDARTVGAISDAVFFDRELIYALERSGIDYEKYDKCLGGDASLRDGLLELMGSSNGESAMRIFLETKAFGCSVEHARGFASRGASAHLILPIFQLGYTPDETLRFAEARINFNEILRYRLYCYPEADRMIDLRNNGISAYALGGFHEMGVYDPEDMVWCLEQGLDSFNLQSWCYSKVYHPLAIRDLQSSGLTPRVVDNARVAVMSNETERNEEWEKLRACTFRIRSGGRYITLYPASAGLVESSTGEPPPELDADRAFLALGGAKSRLLAVTEEWEAEMQGLNADAAVLPAALKKNIREKAHQLWVADRYWTARASWPTTWQGRPD